MIKKIIFGTLTFISFLAVACEVDMEQATFTEFLIMKFGGIALMAFGLYHLGAFREEFYKNKRR